jgi:tRNA(fMet)-specific endonuclease VapC
VTTAINYEEQMRGWIAALSRAKSANSEIQVYARLLQHIASFRSMHVLAFEQPAMAIMQELRSQRISVGAMDLKIASIVLAHNGVLITRNIADFRRVPDLRIEDWTREDT